MTLQKNIQLIQDGSSQILQIPQEFWLASKEVTLSKEGDRLIIKPVEKRSLLEVIATLTGIEEDFPDVDSDLPPLDDINI